MTEEEKVKRDKTAAARPLFDPSIVKRAIVDAFGKLDPRRMIKSRGNLHEPRATLG